MSTKVSIKTAAPPIPKRLKELRSTRGFTLDDLASRAGVSRAMLSKIERGSASPTIGLLCKITSALGVPLTRLVAEPEGWRHRVIRREQLRSLVDRVSGVSRTSLTTEIPEWGFELVRYDMPPGSSTGECGGCSRGIREAFHVTSGRIEISARGATEEIHTGETFLRESDGEGYTIENPGKDAAQFYIVIDRRAPQARSARG